MMAKHTSGPWGWEHGEYDCGVPCTVNGCLGHSNGVPTYLEPVGIYLEEYPDDIEQWIADARLIAVAPDLLAACEARELVLEHYKHCVACMHNEQCDVGFDLGVNEHGLRQVAIAKAKGD